MEENVSGCFFLNTVYRSGFDPEIKQYGCVWSKFGSWLYEAWISWI